MHIYLNNYHLYNSIFFIIYDLYILVVVTFNLVINNVTYTVIQLL